MSSPTSFPLRTRTAVQALLQNTRILGRTEVKEATVSLEDIAAGHTAALEAMNLASLTAEDGSFVHRNVIWLCSRRAAKSTSIMALMALDASMRDGVQIYFGKTKPAVKLSIWSRIWKPLCKKYYDGKCVHNESSMVTTFTTGAVVAFTGTDDQGHIDTYLGNKFRRVVIDECFPAGTMIDGRPIESIQVGEFVSCVDHLTGETVKRRVVRRFQKTTTKSLCVLRLSNGNTLTCTPDHPVFVRGKGYRHASKTEPGDMLLVRSEFSVHREAGAREEVLHERPSTRVVESPRSHPVRKERRRPRQHQARHDASQPHAFIVRAEKGFFDPPGDEAQAEDPGREWAWSDGSREGAGDCADRVGAELRREHGYGPAQVRLDLPDLLQAGSGGPEVEDLYRGRWSKPLLPGAPSSRSEEREVLAWHRVEGLSRVEPGSSEGTAVYNLEVEGAHTYFANDVLVHNCQSQSPSVLNPLVDVILPPALGENVGGQLLLAGTIPEVPAGKFYDLWVSGEGWLKRNWNRFANPHLGTVEHQMGRLQEFLTTSGRSIEDPLIRRDWFGEFVFDVAATAYRYDLKRNGYIPEEPEWVEKFLEQYTGDPMFAHFHRTMKPADGTARHGLMAAKPWPGIEVFACAIDPGASDRFSISVVGWGSGTPNVQHVLEFSSKRKAGLSWAHLDPLRRKIQEMYAPSWWFYDAGGSKVVLDTFIGDTGLPALLPAPKSGLKGQVERVASLQVMGLDKTMIGSATEEDYQKARWDPDARAKLQWRWSSQWHPDPAESKRYAMGAYFELFEPAPDEKTAEQIEREKHELTVRRQQAARSGNVLDEDLDAAYAAEEETQWD